MKSRLRPLASALFLAAFVSATDAQEATVDIAKANQEYQAEHFAEAASLYQAAVAAGARDAA
ncbi:MAG: hypothetical protein ABI946_09610, partial [Chthoniobacterales bacterium]